MRILPVTIAFISVLSPIILGQEEPSSERIIEIPGPIADGTLAEPAPQPEPIDFTVLSSRTRRVDVVEAPPMEGLPPVTGTISVTVQMVEDPNLPEPPQPLPALPPQPLPALPPDDPAVLAGMAELEKNHQGMKLLFVSATVYDHSRTFLQIYPNGGQEGTISAWTNIDLNHFSGFTTYRITEPDGSMRDYALLVGIGNIDTEKQRQFLAEQGRDYVGTVIPELPERRLDGPAFVVTEGDTDENAMEILRQMHDLYHVEGTRMENAYLAREAARAERKAYLLANPPVPKDVTIRFWKRTASRATESTTEEATR